MLSSSSLLGNRNPKKRCSYSSSPIFFASFFPQPDCDGSGFAAVMVQIKKPTWPALPFRIGHYCVKSPKQAKEEAEAMEMFRFCTARFRRHDPLEVILGQANLHNKKWPYSHE